MDKLRLLLALLTVYENNFRILHWKLCGDGFHVDHARFGGYYDRVGEFMDETAEQIISMGGSPVTSKEAIEMLNDNDIDAYIFNGADDYQSLFADSAASKMFNLLYEKSMEIATGDYPVEVSDVFIKHLGYYRIEGKFLLGRRLTGLPRDLPQTMIVTSAPDTGPETAEDLG